MAVEVPITVAAEIFLLISGTSTTAKIRLLGATDGCEVGCNEGFLLGLELGCVVGNLLGFTLGCCEGYLLGCLEGCIDGCCDGRELG